MAFVRLTDGFETDAELLMKEFVQEESSEFKVFAAIWRKRNFSFIYMGRQNVKEMCEFTNGIFSLTLNFLEGESFWQQVGGVFLLYALYRNQILYPPVRIRVVLSKFAIMKSLLDAAVASKLRSLHYVLKYLFENALELVASPTLLGPCVRIFDKSKNEFEKKLRMCDFKCNFEEIMENKVLESLEESLLKYEELKSTPATSCTINRSKKLISIMKKLASEHASIDGNYNKLPTTSTNTSSRVRKLRTPNDVHCDYPFLDSDLNQISDSDELTEKNCSNENDCHESELLKSSSRKNIEVGKPSKCAGQSNEVVPERKTKSMKVLRPKRRVVKTRRIRKYYEGSPIKDIVYTNAVTAPKVDFLEESDSED